MSYDAVVIGGGPAGSTAAILLARAGWDVALVEKTAFPRPKVCGEFLSAANWPLLRDLGVFDEYAAEAGPEIRQIGLFAAATSLTGPAPSAAGPGGCWGRALSRERLDTLLLQQALEAGVELFQPWSVLDLRRQDDCWHCSICSRQRGECRVLASRVIIAAHGSWHAGTLPTQPSRRPPSSSDLLAFKTHFRGDDLPLGIMPLLCFPGGYGGMVHCDDGRLSVSFCIQRGRLEACRAAAPGCAAAESVLRYVCRQCEGARHALAKARPDGVWLAAGPIRPGIRSRAMPGVFLVGNAAGEPHPAIADGISMALQAAGLLGRVLTRDAGVVTDGDALRCAGSAYAQLWRRHFGARIHAAAAIANWAMHPAAVIATGPLLRLFPGLLSLAARWTGKGIPAGRRPVSGDLESFTNRGQA